jgi:hypothetical protein
MFTKLAAARQSTSIRPGTVALTLAEGKLVPAGLHHHLVQPATVP